VRGVDLTRPVMPEVFAEIDAAFCRYGILVFPEQPVTDEQQLAFSRLLSSAASALCPPEPYARSRCLAPDRFPQLRPSPPHSASFAASRNTGSSLGSPQPGTRALALEIS